MRSNDDRPIILNLIHQSVVLVMALVAVAFWMKNIDSTAFVTDEERKSEEQALANE